MHTGAHRVTIKTSSRNSRFGTRIQGIGTFILIWNTK